MNNRKTILNFILFFFLCYSAKISGYAQQLPAPHIEYLVSSIKGEVFIQPWFCGTPLLKTAHEQWKKLPTNEQNDLSYLFQLPVYTHCIDSNEYPITVCYNNATQFLSWAQQVLTAAESVWNLEIEQWGFHIPRRGSANSPEDGTIIYIEDNMGSYGYTYTPDLDPQTDDFACLSYIVINSTVASGTYGQEGIETLLLHEMNHACQYATDCNESAFAMEATSSWAEFAEDPQYASFHSFQNDPWHSLSFSGSDDRNEYGASLFIEYVMERFGNSQPSYISQIWNKSTQIGMTNEPDIIDVIEQFAMNETGMNINQIIMDFSEWRYFIGQMDDGNHFTYGNNWTSSEVYVDKYYQLSQLPVDSESFNNDPEQFGTSYIELSVENIGLFDIGLELSGDSDVLWGVNIIIVGNNTNSEQLPVIEQGEANYIIKSNKLSNAVKVIFAITNLGNNFDTDNTQWKSSNILYSIHIQPSSSDDIADIYDTIQEDESYDITEQDRITEQDNFLQDNSYEDKIFQDNEQEKDTQQDAQMYGGCSCRMAN